MTIAQWKTPEVSFPIQFLDPAETTATFYNVTVYKLGAKRADGTFGPADRWNDFFLGSVVTHLSLEDWCLMKGFKLVAVYKGTRPAKPGEKTDLF